MSKKFYFISYVGFEKGVFNGRWNFCSELVGIHPLQWQIENCHYGNIVKTLINWKEVSEEEYYGYLRLNDQEY